MKEWFIASDEIVSGPLNTESVKLGLENGSLPGSCHLWSKGQNDWIPAAKWLHSQSQTESKLKAETSKEWHYAIDGASKGPMGRAELVRAIHGLQNKDQVLVWTKGMKAWVDIYEIEDLREELGLNRRSDPRIELSGNVSVNFEDGASYVAHLKTIAAGGAGVFGNHEQLRSGAHVYLEIQSEFLSETIGTKAEVQYVTDSGYAGFKFLTITVEKKSIITSLINSRRAKLSIAA